MMTKDKTEPIVIIEVVELFLGDTLISNIVTDKKEQHYENAVKNTYAFDCTKTDVSLFEKAILGTLTVNKNITAEVVNIACTIDGNKTITVEFMSR